MIIGKIQFWAFGRWTRGGWGKVTLFHILFQNFFGFLSGFPKWRLWLFRPILGGIFAFRLLFDIFPLPPYTFLLNLILIQSFMTVITLSAKKCSWPVLLRHGFTLIKMLNSILMVINSFVLIGNGPRKLEGDTVGVLGAMLGWTLLAR